MTSPPDMRPMTAKNGLDPCPFCGCKAVKELHGSDRYTQLGGAKITFLEAYCPKCWARIKRRSHGTLVRAWNRRVG